MKSGILLYDKILELSEIVRHTHPRADSAFLSTCQMVVSDIADELVHLAAGVFMAGYRGVIATVWSIKDKDAPQVAEDVYRRILKDGKYGDHSKIEDGWVMGQNSQLLFWIPLSIHAGLYRPSNITIIYKSVATHLDFKRFVHGENWVLCKR